MWGDRGWGLRGIRTDMFSIKTQERMMTNRVEVGVGEKRLGPYKERMTTNGAEVCVGKKD